MYDEIEKEDKKKPRGLRDGIYTEDSGVPVPQDPDAGILNPRNPGKKPKKMAGGGVTRADGCISKGRTKGKMIVMAGGGMC